VETWDVETQEQSSVTTSRLARMPANRAFPDAKYLACLDNALDLSLFNVASGEVIFKKENSLILTQDSAVMPDSLNSFISSLIRNRTLRFSPDGRYFAASSRTKEEAVVDLTTQKKINVSGAIHTAMEYSFTFLGPDRMLGVDSFNPQKSPIVEFPTGKVLDRLPMGGGSLFAATNPRYILIRPIQDLLSALTTCSKKRWSIRTAHPLRYLGRCVHQRAIEREVASTRWGRLRPAPFYNCPLGKLVPCALSVCPLTCIGWLCPAAHVVAFGISTPTRGFCTSAVFKGFLQSNGTFFIDFPSSKN